MSKFLPILTKGALILRQRSIEVSNPSAPEINTLVEQMLDVMYEAQGIGLAANQVGSSARIAVIDPGLSRQPSSIEMNGRQVSCINDWLPLVLINPEVSSVDSPVVSMQEGCLSQPGVTGVVSRPLSVKVKWVTRGCTPNEAIFSGMIARVIQHEVDHLNGILFTDRVAK